MNSLIFENKKFNSKFLWLMLMIVPALLIGSLAIYHTVNQPSVKQEESQIANRLLSDLNWVLPRYRAILQDLSEEEIENDDELSNLNTIYYHLNEAEKARFHYSVATWHEDWPALNEAKQMIWDNLIMARKEGATFTSINSDHLDIDKEHIDWLVEHQVPYLKLNQSNQSLFLLNQALDFLFGLPMIFLILLLYGLKIFADFETAQQKFMLILPFKKITFIFNKLLLLFIMLMTFIGSILLTTFLSRLLNDNVNFSAQWNYPLTSRKMDEIIQFNLGGILLYRLIYFILLIMLLLIILLLLTKYLRNSIVNVILLASICTIGVQVTTLNTKLYHPFNPFAWLNTGEWVRMSSHTDLIIGILMIIMAIGGFIYLLTALQAKQRSKAKTKPYLRKLSKPYFLIKFEILKFKKQRFYIYSFLLLLLGSTFLTLNAYQSHRDNVALMNQETTNYLQFLTEYQNELDLKAQHHPIEQTDYDLMQSIEEELKVYQSIQADLLKQDYSTLSELEATQLEKDYLYLTNQSTYPGTNIPIRDAIFMPNAFINFQVKEWKNRYQIDFVLPGGPFHTEYLPTLEESPRSGELESPFGVNITLFQQYLDERQERHWNFSGLQGVLDFVHEYFFIIIFALNILLYSNAYVKERDGFRTLRFMLVYPVKIRHILSSKMVASYLSTLLLVLVSVILIFVMGSLLGGVGQLNFPVVEYIPARTEFLPSNQQLFTIPLTRQMFMIHPLWRILMIACGLLLSASFFINQLSYLISIFIRNHWISLATTLILITSGVLISTYSHLPVLAYSPFTYLNIPDILSGNLAVRLNQPVINYVTGIIIPIIAGLLCTIGSIMAIGRKQNDDIS